MRDKQYFQNRKFVLRDILKCLIKKECIDSESVAYFPEKYNFTCEDFITMWNFLSSFDKRDDKRPNGKPGDWDEEISYFQIDNFRFILKVFSGQGSDFLFLIPSNENVFEEQFEIELSMDYLELEFPNWIQNEFEKEEEMEKAMKEFMKSDSMQEFIKSWKDKHGK